jgi:hypothetical protein
MSKKEEINKLVSALANSLTHEIGAIVNEKSLYVEKYRKESENFIVISKDILNVLNLNREDKAHIRAALKIELDKELTKRNYLDIKKFKLVDQKIEEVLRDLRINI